jgi:hypothetical protein
MAALWINNQNLTVEVQRRVQAWVANLSHDAMVSIRDNMASATRSSYSRLSSNIIVALKRKRSDHLQRAWPPCCVAPRASYDLSGRSPELSPCPVVIAGDELPKKPASAR